MKNALSFTNLPKQIILTVFLCLIPLAAASEAGPEYPYKTTVINFEDCSIRAQIADTPALRQRGLSGRENLAEGAGMLFVFKRPGTYSFWMKEMNFSLDLIWIFNGEIVEITSNVPPASLMDVNPFRYRCKVPVNHVLEINAGGAEKCGIEVGDKVHISAQAN